MLFVFSIDFVSCLVQHFYFGKRGYRFGLLLLTTTVITMTVVRIRCVALEHVQRTILMLSIYNSPEGRRSKELDSQAPKTWIVVLLLCTLASGKMLPRLSSWF